MPGNATPQFTQKGAITAVRVTALNASSDGGGTIGTDTFLVFTADATNGSFVEYVRIMPRATAVNTTTAATVIRLYISTVAAGATTSANTNLFAEITVPAQTADGSTAATAWFDVPFNLRLPAGQTILAMSSTAPAANTNWGVMAVAGDY